MAYRGLNRSESLVQVADYCIAALAQLPNHTGTPEDIREIFRDRIQPVQHNGGLLPYCRYRHGIVIDHLMHNGNRSTHLTGGADNVRNRGIDVCCTDRKLMHAGQYFFESMAGKLDLLADPGKGFLDLFIGRTGSTDFLKEPG